MTARVWALEASWGREVTYATSVKPILDILATGNPDKARGLRYFHSRVSTSEEMQHLLSRWALKKHARYSILYLAMHGSPGQVGIGSEVMNLEDLAYPIEGKCAGRVIVFGTCSTVAIHARHLKRFLSVTGASAVMGYKTDVAWIPSTAFELMLLDALSENEFVGPGLVAAVRKARRLARWFGKELQFRIVSRLE